MKYLVVLMGIVFSSNAFALHYFNCSNADGSISVQEEEVWGANPLGCSYRGRPVANARITFFTRSKLILEHISSGPVAALDWEDTFTIRARLSRTDGPLVSGFNQEGGIPVIPELAYVDTFLICRETSTSALDFAGSRSNCERVESDEQ